MQLSISSPASLEAFENQKRIPVIQMMPFDRLFSASLEKFPTGTDRIIKSRMRVKLLGETFSPLCPSRHLMNKGNHASVLRIRDIKAVSLHLVSTRRSVGLFEMIRQSNRLVGWLV